MMTALQEIQERFDKIKDHKPKATKKLSELGDILASAYKISPDLANEMWQYIIDLNIADDIANAKFYIAQVFSKITDNLSPEEAASFVMMNPERIRLMVLYGYDGFKLWDCLDTLVRGYIQINAADDAIVCVEYFYEKFDGINSDRTEVYRIARKAASICVEYIKNGDFSEEAEKILDLLCSSENQDVNSIVEITKIVGISGVCEDYDMLFYVARKCKEPVEFFDLLWEARNQFTLDELRDRLRDYIEYCETIPKNYIHEDEENPPSSYKESKLCFYNDLLKEDDSLLEYYFSDSSPCNVARNIICAWIFDNNWGAFVKYVSSIIVASNSKNLDGFLKSELKHYMDACFYGEGRDSHDEFGRSYKELMLERSAPFAKALAHISTITVGCVCHEDFHIFIKEYIQKLNGNLDILNEFGFTDKVDRRSPVKQLKDYIRKFIQSGELDHRHRSAEYDLIMNKFSWHSVCSNADDYAGRIINQAYKFAKDDEIATFFFMHSHEYFYCKDMLSACIRKGDVDRAIELVDMMATTKDYPGYNDLNGRSSLIRLTFMYLINQYANAHKHLSKPKIYLVGEEAESIGITDEMRVIAKQLVDRIMPSLPQRQQQEIKDILHKITPAKNSFDIYIEQLLDDVAVYTTFPRPKGKGSAPEINRLSSKITSCFKQLSDKGRVDIIAQIMERFDLVKDILEPVTYNTWMGIIMNDVSNSNIRLLYQNIPEIFTRYLEYKNITDSDIIRLADRLGKCCSHSEYQSFMDIVFIKKGYIAELDSLWEATSENTKNQLLFGGQTIKIELDYIEIYDDRAKKKDDLIDIELHLLTTKKISKVSSVRVASFKVNEVDFMDEFGWWEFDDEPRIGYKLEGEESNNELTITEGHLKERGVQNVDKIEMQLITKYGRKVLESSPAIILEYDDRSGSYRVRTDAKM